MKRLAQIWRSIGTRYGWLAGNLIFSLPFALISLSNKPAIAASLGDWTNFIATGGSLYRTLFHILFGTIGLIAGALSNLCVVIINTVILPGQNSLFFGSSDTATVVKTAFDSILGVANIIFFIALVVFAIMIITRQGGYNFKKAITALVVAVVVANISYQLVQVLIEVGDALRNQGTALFGGSMSAGTLSVWLQNMAVMAPYISDPEISTAKFILLSFANMAMQLILLYVFFRLMFVLVERAIRLVILTIFAPVQVALGILPEKELQIGGNWLSEVIKWVLVLPVVFLLIGIAKMIMPENTSESIQMLLQNIWVSEANTGTSTPTITGFAFQLFIGLGIMVAAANVPAMLKLPVSAATKFFTDTLTGAAIGGTWKATKSAAGRGTRLAWEMFKNTRLGHRVTTPGRTLSVAREAAERRLKSYEGARETSRVSQANLVNLRGAIDVKIAYEDARASWYKSVTGKEWDTLGENEKTQQNLAFIAANPHWEQRANVAKKQRIAAHKTAREPFEGLHPDALFGILAEAQKIAEEEINKTGHISAQTVSTLQGVFGELDTIAGRPGKQYDPVRERLHRMLYGEKIQYDEKGKLQTTNLYTLLGEDKEHPGQSAWYEWMPKQPYTMSDIGDENDPDHRTALDNHESLARAEAAAGQAKQTLDTLKEELATFESQKTALATARQELDLQLPKDGGITSRLDKLIKLAAEEALFTKGADGKRTVVADAVQPIARITETQILQLSKLSSNPKVAGEIGGILRLGLPSAREKGEIASALKRHKITDADTLADLLTGEQTGKLARNPEALSAAINIAQILQQADPAVINQVTSYLDQSESVMTIDQTITSTREKIKQQEAGLSKLTSTTKSLTDQLESAASGHAGVATIIDEKLATDPSLRSALQSLTSQLGQEIRATALKAGGKFSKASVASLQSKFDELVEKSGIFFHDNLKLDTQDGMSALTRNASKALDYVTRIQAKLNEPTTPPTSTPPTVGP